MSNSVRHKQKRANRAKQMQKENRMIRAGMNSGRNMKVKVTQETMSKQSWLGKFISLFGKGKDERQTSKEAKKRV